MIAHTIKKLETAFLSAESQPTYRPSFEAISEILQSAWRMHREGQRSLALEMCNAAYAYTKVCQSLGTNAQHDVCRAIDDLYLEICGNQRAAA